MIYGTIRHLERYEGLGEALMKGLRFLAGTDFSGVAPGRVEIDGDEVFASVQEYETLADNDTPEAHRKYADIQYLIEGEEFVGVAPLEAMVEEVEAHPERDLWLYHGPTDRVRIGNGRFVVLFPEDAHAPGIAVGARAPARKCVVKVRVG